MILITGVTGQLGRALVPEAGLARAKPDLVINAAAYTSVDAAETHQAAAKACHHTGPERLARLCAEKNIPLICISTDYVLSVSIKLH